jgi:hypothetical protein
MKYVYQVQIIFDGQHRTEGVVASNINAALSKVYSKYPPESKTSPGLNVIGVSRGHEVTIE